MRLRLVCLAASLLALFLIACGGDDNDFMSSVPGPDAGSADASLLDGSVTPGTDSGSPDGATEMPDGGMQSMPDGGGMMMMPEGGGMPVHDAGVSDGGSGTTYALGGTVFGLSGSGFSIKNGTETLAISASGSFTFANRIPEGSFYDVLIQTQPSGPTQTCSVNVPSGFATKDISVAIVCSTNSFAVAGTVSGLKGTGLVLQDNGGDDLSVAADGAFTFATPVLSGTPFAVTIKSQPSNPVQTCSVSGGGGTIGGSDVHSITVNCATNTYTVGGQISGLGASVVLEDNNGDDLTVTSNGSFAFATPVPSGGTYSVTVKTEPTAPTQTCVVTNGTGPIVKANISSVQVTCTTNTYTISGNVTGLAGSGLTLQDNGTDSIPITKNGTFAFPTKVASGQVYSVKAVTEPSGPTQTCTITNGSGTVGSATVTVTVTCTTNTYKVGGTVSGLAANDPLVLDNGTDMVTVTANGAFSFPTAVASGATYTATIGTQPAAPAQTCVVSGGTGTVGAGAVTSISVNCATNTYTIGGTITGLAGTLTLQQNGADTLTLTTNGSFAFATPVASGTNYAVTIKTQPGTPSQTCTLTGATGPVTNANITSVGVSCTTNAYTIGGTITGLATGETVVLQDNLKDNQSVTANGTFAFATKILSGTSYNVTVLTNPASPLTQTCVASQASGSVGGSNVTNVSISCSTNTYTVGGTVSGLAGTGLTLTDNGGDALTVASNGTFTFATSLASGTGYTVGITGQPTNVSQTCALAFATGTVTNANITSVSVTCTTNNYALGGSVSGLGAGDSLVLSNGVTGGGAATVGVTGNGPFQFAASLPSGTAFDVTVSSESGGVNQNCSVSGGTGTIGGADVTSVVVNCATNSYTIGGTVTGLGGGSVVLHDSAGGDDVTVSTNGGFSFGTPVASGSAYTVTITTQPSNPPQTCVFATGTDTGTVAAANVTSVSLSCTNNSYAIGGTITGLATNDSVVLQNGADQLTVAANGTFTFTNPVVTGGSYSVSVLTQPSTPTPEVCTVTNGSGTVGATNVSNVVVTCSGNVSCTTVITSSYNMTTSFPSDINVSYQMVGGGGGEGGGSGGWGAGGGGGSSAIVDQGVTIDYAAGGSGGAEGGGSPGGNGASAQGTFTLAAGDSLAVYVGGGGGSSGYNQGGGGGAGFFGGGGGGPYAQGGGGGGGGTNAGGAGGNGATSGSSFTGGNGQYSPSGLGGQSAAGGAGGPSSDKGGGGGGFGGGGGASDVFSNAQPTAGGSSGANASNTGTSLGGLGATNWAADSTLPAAAGAGATVQGQGGNGGLVILTYSAPSCL
jgi:hypothetical protein